MKKMQICVMLILGVFLNAGAQSLFSDQIVINDSIPNPNTVSAADFDGDGDMDIVAAITNMSESIVVWYKNDGNNNYGKVDTIAIVQAETVAIYSFDMDGDEDIDIVLGSISGVRWYTNDGTGAFDKSEDITNTFLTLGDLCYVTDIDNDGDMDVITLLLPPNNKYIAWYVNDGKGKFDKMEVICNLATENINYISSLDLENDGDMDIVFADNGNINLIRNDGGGNFSDKILISCKKNSYQFYPSDFNGDGFTDVLTSSLNKIIIYLNNGVGGFSGQQTISTDETSLSVFAADLDSDGDKDILYTSYEDPKIAWYANDGLGNFSVQQLIDNYSPTYLHIEDLDGDGNKDLLFSSDEDNRIGWYKNLNQGFISPHEESACNNNSVSFSIINSINVSSYQWQISSDGDFEDLTNNSQYMGVMKETLIINEANIDMDNYRYRCIIEFNDSTFVESEEATLTVYPLPETNNIEGEPSPKPNGVYVYTIANTVGSTYDWTIEGGEISNDMENSIEVVWEDSGYGSLSVIEIDTNTCIGSPVFLEIMVDIKDVEKKYQVKVFPNPTAGNLTILGDNLKKIEIYTQSGKLMQSLEITSKETFLDLKQYARGIYLLRLVLKDEVATQRLILK